MRQLRKLLSLHIVVPVLVAVVAGGVILGTAIALDSGNSTNDDGETTISNPSDPEISTLQNDNGETAISNPSDPEISTLQNDNGETAISHPADPEIPMLQSDIEITRLELSDYGSQLFTESAFSILVQVTNHGQAASGEYTVEIWQEFDPNNVQNRLNVDCPCGIIKMSVMKIMVDSHTMGSLAPQETHIIEKKDVLVDREGLYTISAEITPISWQENNDSHHVESLDMWVAVNLLH